MIKVKSSGDHCIDIYLITSHIRGRAKIDAVTRLKRFIQHRHDILPNFIPSLSYPWIVLSA